MDAVLICLKAEITPGIVEHSFFNQVSLVVDFVLDEDPHEDFDLGRVERAPDKTWAPSLWFSCRLNQLV